MNGPRWGFIPRLVQNASPHGKPKAFNGPGHGDREGFPSHHRGTQDFVQGPRNNPGRQPFMSVDGAGGILLGDVIVGNRSKVAAK